MSARPGAPRGVEALLRSRWGAFALSGLAAGLLLLIGMRIQVESAPSLDPILTDSRGAPEGLTAWVLFQRLDCVGSRWKIEAWNEVAAGDRIRVVGWALDSPEGWPSDGDPVNALKVDFELRAGPSPELSRALRALGVTATPAILVVDRSGRLRSVVPGDVIRSPGDLEKVLGHLESLEFMETPGDVEVGDAW